MRMGTWRYMHGGRCLVYSLMDAMEVQGGFWLGGGGAENAVVANEERGGLFGV